MKTLKLMLLIAMMNTIALIGVTFTLPDIIPVHYNFVGVADRFATRWVTPLFGLIPLILIIIMIIYSAKTKNQPNYVKNRRMETILFSALTVFFIALSWLMVVPVKINNVSLNQFPFPLILGLPLGTLMMIIGNYMGVIKQNRYLGIRTPWTLKNEEVWRKTHRKSAYLSILGGGILIICSFLSYFLSIPNIFFVGIFSSLILITLVPTLYSYLLYRKIISKNR